MTDAERIAELERQLDVAQMTVRLLRAQLRVLGHIPMVVETAEIGKAEYAFRAAARKAGAQ